MRIARDAFLYMDPKSPKNQFAQCKTCVHFIEPKSRCQLFGPKDEVTAGMSCGLYVHGIGSATGRPESRVTPKQAGLVDRQVRCGNCRFFEPERGEMGNCKLYELLNNTLPNQFELQMGVHFLGCCNAQLP